MLGIEPYDEAIRLHGAERIIAGEIPYHDFYAIYGPAQFYWFGSLFKLFGTQLWVARTAAILVCSATICLFFHIARRLGASLTHCWSLTLLLLLPLCGSSNTSLTIYWCDPALLLLIAAAFTMLQPSSRNYFLCGVCVSLAGAFRQDFGVYGVIAFALSLLMFRRGQPWLRWGILFLTGVTTAAIPTYGYLFLFYFHDVLTNLIIIPKHIMEYRRLPYSALDVLAQWFHIPWKMSSTTVIDHSTLEKIFVQLLWTTPFLTATSFYFLAKNRLTPDPARETDVPKSQFLPFCVVASVMLGVYGFGRSDAPHLYPLYAFTLLLFASLAENHLTVNQNEKQPSRGITLALFLCLGIVVSSSWYDYSHAEPLSGPRSSGIRITKDDPSVWLNQAASKLREHSQANEKVFICNHRHDRVFISYIMPYFLSGRWAGTRYYHFDPGLTTTNEIQEEIIQDLKENQVKLILMVDEPIVLEPNKSRESSGVTKLDDFIRQEYQQFDTFQHFTLWSRSDDHSQVEK